MFNANEKQSAANKWSRESAHSWTKPPRERIQSSPIKQISTTATTFWKRRKNVCNVYKTTSLYIDMGHRTAEVCWMASLVYEKVKQHCAHLLSFFLFLSLNTSFILCASGASNEKVVKRSRALRQLLKHRFVDLDVELFTWIWRVTIALLGIVMALVFVQPRSGFGWKKCRCGCRGKHKLKPTVRYENRVNIYKLYKY